MASIDSNTMGPLPTKLSPSKSNSGGEEGVYYAVYVPPDLLGGYDNEFAECDKVFNNKEKALLFIKKNKKIRFKSFRNLRDAQNFAYTGCPTLNNSFAESGFSGGVDTLSSPTLPTPSSMVSAEKPSPFKSLKSQDLVKLRKLIEKGNLAEVKRLVWENPRYLVSSGDFPTILHEGCRYNALHVSTKAMNCDMTELLLEVIGNPEFTNLLYDTSAQSNHSYIERSDILLDLYLNTPDKALNETPLHFASKFGAVDCVKKLIACAKTQTHARNKDGKTPLEVCCLRCASATEEVKSSIRKLLSEEQFFVPIWASNDACDIPLVGAPCKTNVTPSKMSMRRDETDITSPTLEIKAFAGPMNESNAKVFRNKWRREMKSTDVLASPQSPLRTPRKINSSVNDSSLNYSYQSPPPSVEKSFEIVGRRLALENKLEWRENWPFLNKCVDLQSIPGLEMLESYIQNKLMETLSSQKDIYDVEVQEKDVSGNVSVDNNNSSCMISPIEKLCQNFDTLSLSGNSFRSEPSSGASVSNMSHLLIEKSCEVFAKRLLQGLKNASFDRNRGSLVRILRQEAKHLNNLCSSFIRDARFQGVNLNRIHSMIAKYLLVLLMNSCPPECVEWILTTFNEIAKSKLLSSYSLECDNTSTGSDKSPVNEEDNASVLCLITQMLDELNRSGCDGNTAQLSEDSNANNTDDIIQGKRLIGKASHVQDQGSYNRSDPCKHALNGISNSSESNKLIDNDMDNRLFTSLSTFNASGVLENGSANSESNLNIRQKQTEELNGNVTDRKSLTNLSNSCSVERTKADDVFLKPADVSSKLTHHSVDGTSEPLSFSKYLKDLSQNLPYVSSSSEKEAEKKWNLSATCQCTTRVLPPRNIFSNIRSYSRFGNYRANAWASKGKRIDFDMEDNAPMRVRSVTMNESSGSLSDKSIAETNYNLSYASTSSSDSSDTDDEYYTPTGSYTTEQVQLSSSEEEMMDAADEDIEIFLIGNSLSATDIDVFQTLAQCPSIDSAKYPNIYKWRHLVQLKLREMEMNRFLLTPATPGTRPRNVNRIPAFTLPSPRVLFSPRGAPAREGNYIPLQSSTPSGEKS